DEANRPAVLSSSYPVTGQPTENSPFNWAWKELFKDGALSNTSVLMAAGDEGASANIPNGLVNVAHAHSSISRLLVGGTPTATLAAAIADPTLNTPDPTVQNLVQQALHNDPATVFPMVAAGLKTLPSNLSAAAPTPADAATTLTKMFETVWQQI